MPLYILFLSCIVIVNCREKSVNIPTNPYASWSLSDPGLQRRSLNFPLGEEWNLRVQDLDDVHQNTIISLNEIDGISERPIASPQAADFSRKLFAIRKSFPDKVNQQLDQYLMGIYFVKNLGSSGVTGIIRYNQEPIGGIVFLDTSLLSKKANEWASYKDRSVFQLKDGEDLYVKIEEDEQNNIENALAFILLHEFGHIISVVDKIAPDTSLMKRDFRGFPFYKGFWLSEVESEYDANIHKKSEIKFYAKGSIPLDPDGLDIYSELEDTPFVTLYASTNADDSFSEAYASYVHVVLQKKPYEVYFKKGQDTKLIFKNGITRSDAENQVEVLNKLFGIK